MMASPRQLRKPACRVKVSALTLKALLRCVNWTLNNWTAALGGSPLPVARWY